MSYCFLHASCFSNLHVLPYYCVQCCVGIRFEGSSIKFLQQNEEGCTCTNIFPNKGRKHHQCSSQILRQVCRPAESCWRTFPLNFSWWMGQERFPVLKQTILSYFWGAQKASWKELISTLVWNGNHGNISEKTLSYPLSSSMYFRVKLDWIRFEASCVSLSLNWLHSSDWKI